MPVGVTNIYIYSNDGSTQLSYFSYGFTPVEVTDNGLGQYTYSGSGTFLGLATSANATTPTYAVGDEIALSLGGDTLNLYIVEEAASGVIITYNNAVIASLKAGQSASLPCKDKPMHTDVVVTVPEGMGAGEVVEEWDGSIEVV